MGADKKYITRDKVLGHLRAAGGLRGLQRSVNIERVFQAEAQVMDSWSSRFFSDLRPEERQVRDSARLSAPGQLFCREEVISRLGSLAEALVSLHHDPIPEDFVVVLRSLGATGFDGMDTITLRDYCITLVADHFGRGS
jgi:hypothetical protein